MTLFPCYFELNGSGARKISLLGQLKGPLNILFEALRAPLRSVLSLISERKKKRPEIEAIDRSTAPPPPPINYQRINYRTSQAILLNTTTYSCSLFIISQ